MWDQHLKLWNGDMRDLDRIRTYVKEDVSRTEHRRRMAASFSNLLLGLVVAKPEHGKWTKVSQTLDAIVPLHVHNDMLRKLIFAAGGQQQFEAQRSDGFQGTLTIQAKGQLPR